MEREKAWLLKEKYNGEKTEGFFADSERLDRGEPIAYIIGHVPFLNSVIYLDSKPLIPRPETEYWVFNVIEEMRTKKSSRLTVLDLCAGSGCIGVSVLKAVPEATVDFVEIETSHHKTIVKNIESNGIPKSRATVLGGDLFERVTKKYDFILTNPPYIDPALKRTDVSVTEYEPKEALWGGVGGIKYILKILGSASTFLEPSGMLYLEHEPEQETDIRKHTRNLNLATKFFPDQFGIIRYVRVTYGPQK